MNRGNKPELLAPAGSMQALIAALKQGADGVYLGALAFGARSSAGFDRQQLVEAVHTAHMHEKRVYVTVNTLIKPQEWSAVAELLAMVDEAGADAVIVQDIGLLRHIKKHHPSLPIHASTQMSIHNAAGAKLLLQEGVSRVVLARECSIDTIGGICKTGIETEVFVHGALCVAVSGQCLMSSQIGGRSGNRGRCAQPCRMRYLYRDKEGAWLSPRDLMLLNRVPELVHAGVSSFKIEGRLKSATYVAAATRAYREAIDAAWDGADFCAQQTIHQGNLLQTFNRGGFTEGLAFNRSNPRYIYPLRVSHEGMPIGRVLKCEQRGSVFLSEVLLKSGIQHGDHLQLRGKTEQEMTYSGPPFGAGQKVTLRHHKAAAQGDTVHRLLDSALEQQLEEATGQPFSPIAASAHLRAVPGEPLELQLRDNLGNHVTVRGQTAQAARTTPMTEDSARAAISKTGDSPFQVDSFALEGRDAWFAPVSGLNALRRDGIQQLEQKRLAAWHRSPVPAAAVTDRTPPRFPEHPRLFARVRTVAQAKSARSSGAQSVLFAPEDYTGERLPQDLRSLSEEDFFCLPRQTTDQTLSLLQTLAAASNVNVLVDNIAQLSLSWPRRVIAGDGIPCWNERAGAFLQSMGCAASVVSSELSGDEAQALMENSPLAMIVRVYGRVVTMLLNHCPELMFRQSPGPQTACHRCDAGSGTRGQSLVDTKGAAFPLLPVRLPDGCLNQVLFHTPLHLSRRAFGSHWLLDFTVETEQEVSQVTAYYAAVMNGSRTLPELQLPYCLGRLNEGVQ